MNIWNNYIFYNNKFLNLFNLKPINYSYNNISLKNQMIFIHFMLSNIFLIQLFLDYMYAKSLCIICPIFNFCLFTPLNYISLYFLIKSFTIKQNEHKYFYISNLCIIYAFYFHFALLLFNTSFGYFFSSIDLFYIYKAKNKCYHRDKGIKKFLSFTFPNILYLLFELYLTWAYYCYIRISILKKDSHINNKIDLNSNNKNKLSIEINKSEKII